ncbi:MAG: hypothetical protein ACOX7J_09025, partial [Bacillota bacterium]
YEHFKKRKDWEGLSRHLPTLIEHHLNAVVVYEELKAEAHWVILARNFSVFKESGLTVDYDKIYQELLVRGCWHDIADAAACFIAAGIEAVAIYNALKEKEQWHCIASSLAVFTENGIEAAEIYDNLKKENLWHDIDDNLSLFLKNGINARKIYNDLRSCGKWWCITNNLNAFAASGITAESIYNELKKEGIWSQIVDNAAAFISNGVIIDDIEVYDFLRQNGTWSAWSNVSQFLSSHPISKPNLEKILSRFNTNGWWEEIAYSLPVFTDNSINVDVDMIYEYLKAEDWWKTILESLTAFLDNGINANDIYEGLKKKGTWGIDQIVKNLSPLLAGGLNPALYILDAEPLQLLKSIQTIINYCEPSEMVSAFKLRDEAVVDDKYFMLALKKGFMLSEILKYPFICSPLLEAHL